MIDQTLTHYSNRALPFWEGTKDHDVTQNYQALLEALPQKQLTLLDFGCGPGRDLAYFKSLGHKVIGLDGCSEFCEMARDHSSCEVWHQDFMNLDLPDAFFDGVFANASLFHVLKSDLPRVLKEMHQSLKPGGVLFSSNPRGHGEGFDGSRYGNYMELTEYESLLVAAGFKIRKHYYRPAGLPRTQQPWLAVVSQAL